MRLGKGNLVCAPVPSHYNTLGTAPPWPMAALRAGSPVQGADFGYETFPRDGSRAIQPLGIIRRDAPAVGRASHEQPVRSAARTPLTACSRRASRPPNTQNQAYAPGAR